MEVMNYLEPPDVPEGLTLREWRRQGSRPTDGGERIRLVRRLRRMCRRWTRLSG
jgi:hypothetical protein